MIARYRLALGVTTLLAITGGQLANVRADEPPARTVRVTIPNMHCESCAKKIRSHLFSIAGVAKVSTTVTQDLAVVEPIPGKTLSAFDIWETLEKADFTPSKIVTPEAEYDEKPPQASCLPSLPSAAAAGVRP